MMNNRIENLLLKYVHKRFSNDYIVCLHDVSDANENNFSITPRMLREFLQNRGSTSFIRIGDMLTTDRVSSNHSSRYVVTFDDGFESIYTQVYPLMKEMGIPFACYITTNYIDKKGYISKEQIKLLANDPICEIGSHMVSHSWTREMSTEEIFIEWKESKKILSELSGQKVMHAALPYGSLLACSRKSIKLAFEAGFVSVATTAARPYIKGSHILPRCTYSKESGIFSLICEKDGKI